MPTSQTEAKPLQQSKVCSAKWGVQVVCKECSVFFKKSNPLAVFFVIPGNVCFISRKVGDTVNTQKH